MKIFIDKVENAAAKTIKTRLQKALIDEKRGESGIFGFS